ncbi:MAG: EF-P beta-lysylation protein EpmB [Legionellales bacterium RIFCSPHIGHO2_12_FULL_35_11]|nr:MAG: EF-P beta-lysylation protein EpmB [Legionellales bacterium RIFCSPHIGHO2_12_FULL_35_11]
MRDSSENWQAVLVNGFSSAKLLLEYLHLPDHKFSTLAQKSFATRVPLHFASLMEKKNPQDPLLLQVLASLEEEVLQEGYTDDPLLEKEYNKIPGLIHKYSSRVLLTITGICAINCRYCFRREFPYQINNPGRLGWQKAFDYIAENKNISEVIFSGGDPLLAADSTLEYLFSKIASISHVQILRIHTRVPVVLPERIGEKLLQIIANSHLRIVIVLHCNHPNEISPKLEEVCYNLRKIGCHLLNQTVLLKGVNTNSATLINLSYRLFAINVLPYYLHLLDKTSGTGHFDIAEDDAKAIFREMQKNLPGYLLPRMVREEHGKTSKTQILA